MVRPETIGASIEGGINREVLMSVFKGAYRDYQIKVGQVQDYNPKTKEVSEEGAQVGLSLWIANTHIV